MSRRIVEGCYARLRGIDNTLGSLIGEGGVHHSLGMDYQTVLEQLRESVDDPFSGFDLSNSDTWNSSDKDYHWSRIIVRSKVTQLIYYLEAVHSARDRVVEIGSVYNLIKDTELKSRCADLLSASGHFDRVINQATQVLEERIRKLVPEFSGDHGSVLVGKSINSDPGKSKIVVSQEASEQEGYAAIFRGVVGAFRNPTHHRFLENVTREQALQICAFIDNLLFALSVSNVARD